MQGSNLLRVRYFYSHALCMLSADDLGDFSVILLKSHRIVGGQHVQSMRVKRSDPQNDFFSLQLFCVAYQKENRAEPCHVSSCHVFFLHALSCACIKSRGGVLKAITGDGVGSLQYPPAQHQYMQEKILEEFIFVHDYMWGLYSHLRKYREYFREILFEKLYSHLRKYVFSPLPRLSVWIQWLYSHTLDANA